jgi:hypothetical protein
MASTSATINGWRARAEKKWFPTNGNWVANGSSTGINASISAPTTSSTGSTSSNNKYGIMVKITTPNVPNITSLSITFQVYDRNTT